MGIPVEYVPRVMVVFNCPLKTKLVESAENVMELQEFNK